MQPHLSMGALAATAALSACFASESPVSPGVAVTIAPLSLPGVTDATYTLTVANHGGQVVMTREVSSSAYGAGDGSLSYVAPCDADDNDNAVTLELLHLYDGATEIPASDYDNPGPLSRSFTCLPNQDVAVSFELTLARRATQGFFDVAVTFDEIFCSAKLDCLDEANAPLELLFNGAERDTTIVLGFACTGGVNAASTTLYRDDVELACANGTVRVDPSRGPGNLSYSDGISGTAGLLFGAAVYAGAEQLGYEKRYWNVLLGLTSAAHSCTVTNTATATHGSFAAMTTPAGQTWPLVTWSVPVTDAAGALLCSHHPLHGQDAAAGVATTYTDGDPPVAFAYAYSSAATVPQANVCAVGAATCPHASCDALLRAGVATSDGWQIIDPDGAGPLTAVEVWCDMTTDGGGWTVVARAFDVAYAPAPPTIGDGTAGTWASWAAHSWRSGDSYYLSLDAFDALTASTVALVQRTRTVAAVTKREARWASFRYDAGTNEAWLGSCANVVGSPCGSSYSWGHRGTHPGGFFDGYQQPGGGTTNCNAGYGAQIWNYHNWANCASDSGLFAFTGATPRPSDLGSYTNAEYENLIMVRAYPTAEGTSCANLLALNPTAASGVHVIDPDGAGPRLPFAVYCDLTPGDAGWTYGLIVDTTTPSAGYTRVAGYTAFGAAGPPILGTAYGVDLTGITFSDVRIDNFQLGTRVSHSAAAPLTWGGTQYTSSGSLAAMKFDLAGGVSLRAGYYVGGCGAQDAHIPVCFSSTAPSGWVCDSDWQYIEGWLDCSGGELCTPSATNEKVWRDLNDAAVCHRYLAAPTPAVYGFAVR